MTLRYKTAVGKSRGDGSKVARREMPRSATEIAKRMRVMLRKGQWMAPRRAPPSSEKTSHRRHRRHEAKYIPIRIACTVIPMIYTSEVVGSTSEAISSTISRYVNADIYTILWLVTLSEQMERKYNEPWQASPWSTMAALGANTNLYPETGPTSFKRIK